MILLIFLCVVITNLSPSYCNEYINSTILVNIKLGKKTCCNGFTYLLDNNLEFYNIMYSNVNVSINIENCYFNNSIFKNTKHKNISILLTSKSNIQKNIAIIPITCKITIDITCTKNGKKKCLAQEKLPKTPNLIYKTAEHVNGIIDLNIYGSCVKYVYTRVNIYEISNGNLIYDQLDSNFLKLNTK
ncbi:130L protein [Yaba-like disease virus]|uniref:130L protein n=1 Tax=Yaba-like disease virus TaxID=132475 RepID=Q9DHI3_YLDV|nr:130L protein [Yaba-like disease virus]CAC21368.1 130L protein [Yaba-like disease virus]